MGLGGRGGTCPCPEPTAQCQVFQSPAQTLLVTPRCQGLSACSGTGVCLCTSRVRHIGHIVSDNECSLKKERPDSHTRCTWQELGKSELPGSLQRGLRARGPASCRDLLEPWRGSWQWGPEADRGGGVLSEGGLRPAARGESGHPRGGGLDQGQSRGLEPAASGTASLCRLGSPVPSLGLRLSICRIGH